MVLFIGGALLYISARLRAPAPEEEVAPRELIPFGPPPEVEVPEFVPEIAEVPEIPPEVEEIVPPRLKKVASFSVSGAEIFEIERMREAKIEDAVDFSEYPIIKEGKSGSGVEDLQKILNLFLKENQRPQIETSEEFNEDTKEALIFFQEQNGLDADGIAGPKTYAALNQWQGIGKETVPAVRYVKRSSGHLYQTFLDDLDKSETERVAKLSVTTIPRIQEAFIGGGGGNVILRYLADDGRTIETFSGLLTKNGTEGELEGVFMPQNILDVSVSPDKENFFYLALNGDRVLGIVSDFDSGDKKQVLKSFFTEWLSQWIDNKDILLTTKASGLAPGFAYILDSKTKTLEKVMGDVAGLTTLAAPSGDTILFSRSTTDSFLTGILNIEDGYEMIDLEVATLPEKCVFASSPLALYCAVPESIPTETYPDAWYQGLVSFSDSLWKIDPETGTADLITSLSGEAKEPIDAVDLKINKEESFITFINKNDSTLWSYEI